MDRIFYIDDTMVAGIKNVTMNEPFFVGHFPEEPVMPGVLIVEAMAQCCGMLVLRNIPDPEHYSTYFMKIDGVNSSARSFRAIPFTSKFNCWSPSDEA